MKERCLRLNIRAFIFMVTALTLLLGLGAFKVSFAKNSVPDSFAELAAREGTAAVNISTTKTVKTSRSFSPFQGRDMRDFFGDEFFKHFFGGEPEGTMKQRSLGSGFVVTDDGYILTNNHVVADADEIQVTFSENEKYEAKIIGRDEKTDIALIKIDIDKKLTAVKLGDSDKLRIGDWVVAIGNPFGLGNTVTAGIVSAKGRIIGAGPYDNFIQTDASINPGNSGGPLFNLEGEVVGINTAIVAPTGGNVGIGFAIPINMAKSVMSQLKEKGKVVRGWIGVTIQTITSALKEKFELEELEGALVAEVTENSPAEKAGLQRGDVIVSFDGKTVKNMQLLPSIVAETPVGKEVEVLVVRKGEKKKLTLEVGELKEEATAAGKIAPEKEEKLGLTVQELTPELAESLSIEDEEGVVVSGVTRGSPAYEAGLRRGDLILEIENEPVKDMGDYRRIIKKTSSKKQLLMVIMREGHTSYVVLTKENE
ncbi:MAG: DegQ family serine endoprotease [Deltaproteobacteria bacterium]|nr:DegQ family serine endoprotease [Deltaproteobacteria bacterium]